MATTNPVEMTRGQFADWAVETYGVDYDQILFADMLRTMDTKIAEQPEGDGGFPVELINILRARKGQVPIVVEAPAVETVETEQATPADAKPVRLIQFFSNSTKSYDVAGLRSEQREQTQRLANSTPLAGYRNQYRPNDDGSVFEAYDYAAAIVEAERRNAVGQQPGETTFESEWIERGSRTGE